MGKEKEYFDKFPASDNLSFRNGFENPEREESVNIRPGRDCLSHRPSHQQYEQKESFTKENEMSNVPVNDMERKKEVGKEHLPLTCVIL